MEFIDASLTTPFTMSVSGSRGQENQNLQKHYFWVKKNI